MDGRFMVQQAERSSQPQLQRPVRRAGTEVTLPVGSVTRSGHPERRVPGARRLRRAPRFGASGVDPLRLPKVRYSLGASRRPSLTTPLVFADFFWLPKSKPSRAASGK